MTQEISDLQKKRACNLIWNAAADYGFTPDFKFYTTDGTADVYWNSIFGLARKYYDYPQLRSSTPPTGPPMSIGTASSASPANTMITRS